jgi:pyruvate/2-oxoglutarate dehydrogenase complex dihydrolipoamide acyltransferase (E2) component
MRLPQLGMGMTDADIVEWLSSEGDRISQNAPLLLIETAKAEVELNAPVAGVLRKIIAPVGSRVDVGHPIALIGDPSEPLPTDLENTAR